MPQNLVEDLRAVLQELASRIRALGHAPTTAKIQQLLDLVADAELILNPPVSAPPLKEETKPEKKPEAPPIPRAQPKVAAKPAVMQSPPVKAKPEARNTGIVPKGKPYKWPKK